MNNNIKCFILGQGLYPVFLKKVLGGVLFLKCRFLLITREVLLLRGVLFRWQP